MNPMIDGPRACGQDDFDETIALINATFRANSDQNIRTDCPLSSIRLGLRPMVSMDALFDKGVAEGIDLSLTHAGM